MSGSREGLSAFLESLEALREEYASEPEQTMEAVARLCRAMRTSAPHATAAGTRLDAALRAFDGEPPEDPLPLVDELHDALVEHGRGRPGATRRVLVVEDDPVIAKVVGAALGARDREVLVAQSAAAAEKLLAQRAVQLIVMDLMLPDMDGRNLLVRLREDPRTRRIPVFVITGRENRSTRIECIALGADQFFHKPIDMRLLAAAAGASLQASSEVEASIARDELTGLPNQAGFFENYNRYAALARRSNEALSLALIDLDGMTEVNERLGRVGGDALLQRTAVLLDESLRDSDVVARWDADEFVILMPATDADGARIAMRKLQEVLRERAQSHGDVAAEFCVGLCAVQPGCEATDAVALADRGLYQAKRLGLGRIVRADEEQEQDRSRTVLLIEDDPITATVVRHRMTRDGFTLVYFADGRKAAEFIQDNPADLVILDLKLPGMDGFEVLQRIRANPQYKETPVAVVSGLGREEDVVRALELGADDYIMKPFSTAELRARVHRLLRNRGGDGLQDVG